MTEFVDLGDVGGVCETDLEILVLQRIVHNNPLNKQRKLYILFHGSNPRSPYLKRPVPSKLAIEILFISTSFDRAFDSPVSSYLSCVVSGELNQGMAVFPPGLNGCQSDNELKRSKVQSVHNRFFKDHAGLSGEYDWGGDKVDWVGFCVHYLDLVVEVGKTSVD